MRLTRQQRWLLGGQALALVAVLGWAAWSLWSTERELERLRLSDRCPDDGQELLMVPIVYGALPAEAAAPEGLFAYTVEPASEDAPAFLLRCPQCGYRAPGVSIAQMRLLDPGWLERQAAAIAAEREAPATPTLAATTDSGVDGDVVLPKQLEPGAPRQ